MATDKQDVDTQSLWKSRYYEALGEIEEREKSWREAEGLLRHLITRLTLAADTRHRALTRNLTELRNAVSDNRDVLQLHELLDHISTQVAELDDMRSKTTEQAHPAMALMEILDKLQLQEADVRELRQLKKQIAQLRPDEEAAEVYAGFVELLNGALGAVDVGVPAQTRKQKLIDRILLRQEKAKVEENGKDAAKQVSQPISQRLLAPAVGDLLLQLALRMPDAVKRSINFPALKKHTNRARQRKDLIAIVDVIAQYVETAYTEEEPSPILLDDDSVAALARAIHQVLQKMNPPQDLRQRIADLEKIYSESCNDVDSLIHCLNSLAELMAEICSRLAYQRIELETFFVQLSMRLEDFDLGLQKTSRIYNESHQDNLHMDKAVQDELRGIRDSMQTVNDLAQMKSAIQLRLDAIDKHLIRYNDAEKQRFEQAQNTIVGLSDKVAELESDGTQVHDHLEETENQVMRDVLTGIPSRQAYEEKLASEVARGKRYMTPLSMVVWDVDKFTVINDNYGLAGGDRVLKVLAEILSAQVRETDFVARYGGEEFVMLLPGTTLDAALQVADKLRQKIEETPFRFHDNRVAVTISAGVAQYHQDEMITSLFERAETALYAAKEAGRNQVKSAED